MHANEEKFAIFAIRMKRFLDDEWLIVKLAGMKNLTKLAALVVISGMLGSCGIPMAAVRTAQSTARTLVSTAQSPLGY
jgi:hypothetical protein